MVDMSWFRPLGIIGVRASVISSAKRIKAANTPGILKEVVSDDSIDREVEDGRDLGKLGRAETRRQDHATPPTTNSGPTSSITTAAPTIASHTPTSSTPAVSPTLASHNSTGYGRLNKSDRSAIGLVLLVVAIVAGFIIWLFLGRQRRRIWAVADPLDERFEGRSAGDLVPQLYPRGELLSGLDRAELVTRQWDCPEMPSRHDVAELAVRS